MPKPRDQFRHRHELTFLAAALAGAITLAGCGTDETPGPPPVLPGSSTLPRPAPTTTGRPSPTSITTRSTPAAPTPPRTTKTTTPATLQATCQAAGYSVCGFVTRDGSPVPGVTVEFKFGAQNQTTVTNERGGYGIHLTMPAANAICIEPDALLDAHFSCGAVGTNGTPVSVGSDDQGRIVNFMFCPVDDYPDCLRR